VPNAFAREWLENKFRPQVRTTLQHLLGRTVDVRFVTSANGGVRPGSPPASTFAQQTSTQERREAPVSAVLNQRYTFSTFVVGSNNRLAHAAALSVAERPGHSCHPLCVHGGLGPGQPHHRPA